MKNHRTLCYMIITIFIQFMDFMSCLYFRAQNDSENHQQENSTVALDFG